jgi:hypothetical protein
VQDLARELVLLDVCEENLGKALDLVENPGMDCGPARGEVSQDGLSPDDPPG